MTDASDASGSVWPLLAASGLAGALAAMSYAAWLAATQVDAPQFNAIGYAVLGLRAGASALMAGAILFVVLVGDPSYARYLRSVWIQTALAAFGGAAIGLATLALHLPDELWEIMTD